MPSLYEAFAIVDGDEWRRRLLPPISLTETSPTVPDQTTFVVPIGSRPYCQHYHKSDRLINCCFDLNTKLKMQLNWNRGGHATPQVGAIVEVEPTHAELPTLNQLQTQIAQLQSHLDLAPSSSSSSPMAIWLQKILPPFMVSQVTPLGFWG